MTAAPHPSLLVYLGVAALVGWRIYRRVRRLVGRQRLTRVRPWLTATLFPLLALVVLAAAGLRPERAAAEIAGLAVGVALGVWALRLTRFEATSDGLFYTPNAHIGIALSLLMIGRIGYRFVQIGLVAGAASADASLAGGPPDAFLRSPLTIAIFGTLAGYYATYAIGLLRWRQQQRASGDGAAPEA